MSKDVTKLRIPKKSLSKKSLRSFPEIEIKSIKSVISNNDDNDDNDDFLQSPPTPFTHYITGYHPDCDEVLQYDNIEVQDEIPMEHQNTHHRRDSSIGIPSIASTTYFSTTQSVHSRNDSIYSLQMPNSKRSSKRLSPQLNSDLVNRIGEGGMETSKRNTRRSSLFKRHDSLCDNDSINELLNSQNGENDDDKLLIYYLFIFVINCLCISIIIF